MNALTDGDLTIGDELPPKILESCLSLLSMASRRDVAPGEVMTVEVRSSHSEFPEKTFFGQETSGCFEVDEIALRPWMRSPRVLQSRDRGDRTDLASVDELLHRVMALPPNCHRRANLEAADRIWRQRTKKRALPPAVSTRTPGPHDQLSAAAASLVTKVH